MTPTARLDSLSLDVRDAASGCIRLPGSKSLSIRALLLGALAEGTTRLEGLLLSDDTRVMIGALRQLGVPVEPLGEGAWQVSGQGGRLRAAPDHKLLEIFVGNSGLSIRSLVPALVGLLASQPEGPEVRLHGVPRMHERPIGDLVEGLRAIGADIVHEGQEGYPPLRIRPAELAPRAELSVRADVSSQFLTGLLQLAPGLAIRWGQPVRVRAEGRLISRPYVDLTVALLRQFGAGVVEVEPQVFEVTPASGAGASGLISPGLLELEGDASTASYFLAAGLLGGGPVRVEGAGADSLQGDVAFAHALEQMGAEIRWESNAIVARAAARRPDGLPLVHGVDLDCNAIPDAAMTLVAVALYADSPTTLRNIASWKVKETDRIAAMQAEAERLGARVESGEDFIRIHPPSRLQTATLHTYDDHRVAMSFALASFRHAGDLLSASEASGRQVCLLDPGCTAKTFPEFFDEFSRLCAEAVPVIAIDGPTASGKGTIAARVAQHLGYRVLDSGALYRGLALLSLRAGLPASGEEAVAPHVALATGLQMEFREGEAWLVGECVTDELRAEAVGQRASELAVIPEVRQALLRRQRDAARAPGLVADGRDMGSVVFPRALAKFYLTASAEVRAERRYKQLMDKGVSANLAGLLEGLKARDERDASRAVAPLQFEAGQGVVWLDASSLSIDEVVQQVLRHLQEGTPRVR